MRSSVIAGVRSSAWGAWRSKSLSIVGLFFFHLHVFQSIDSSVLMETIGRALIWYCGIETMDGDHQSHSICIADI